MSASHHRWLLDRLPEWQAEGLLTADSERKLKERAEAAVAAGGANVAMVMIGVVGALLVGSGLIAIIGYNWDDFTRPVRLLFAFLPMLLAQATTWRVLSRKEAIAPWIKEAAGLFHVLAVGAAIALVSQIYNMGGAWAEFLLAWCVLILPLTWMLRAHSVVIFYLISIAIWMIDKLDWYVSSVHVEWHCSPWLYLVLLAGLIPFWPGLRQPHSRLPTLTRWLLVISAGVGISCLNWFLAEQHEEEWSFLILHHLTHTVFLLVPLSAAGLGEGIGRKPQLILASWGIISMVIANTFANDELYLHMAKGASVTLAHPWGLALLALSLVLGVVAFRQGRWAVLLLASLGLTSLCVTSFADEQGASVLAWASNIHLALVGIGLIFLELLGKDSAARVGAAVLGALVIARMADSDLSLLGKGVVFIIVGLAFLGFNVWVGRHRKKGAGT